MSEPIPEDVMQKARTIADEVTFGDYTSNTLKIARGIMADRERAARIVLAMMGGNAPGYSASNIAAAIRDAA